MNNILDKKSAEYWEGNIDGSNETATRYEGYAAQDEAQRKSDWKLYRIIIGGVILLTGAGCTIFGYTLHH